MGHSQFSMIIFVSIISNGNDKISGLDNDHYRSKALSGTLL